MATEVRASQLVVGQDAPSNPPEVRNVSVVVGQDAPSNPPEVRNVALVVAYEQLTGPEVLDQADYYYTAEDITSGAQQTIPNRGTAGPADSFLGPSAPVEPQDPTWAASPRRLVLDGVNDYIQHPDGTNPSSYMTETTGKYTVLVCLDPGAPTGFDGIFGTGASGFSPLSIFSDGSGNVRATTRNASEPNADTNSRAAVAGDRAIGAVWDDGNLYLYTNNLGLTAAKDYTSLTSGIPFGGTTKSATMSSAGSIGASVLAGVWYATAIWHNHALTEDDLNAAADELLARVAAGGGGGGGGGGEPIGLGLRSLGIHN